VNRSDSFTSRTLPAVLFRRRRRRVGVGLSVNGRALSTVQDGSRTLRQDGSFSGPKLVQAVEDGQDAFNGPRCLARRTFSPVKTRVQNESKTCKTLSTEQHFQRSKTSPKHGGHFLYGLFQQNLFDGPRWAGRPVSNFQRSKSLRRYRKRVQDGSKTRTQNRSKSTRTLSVGLFSTELRQRSKGSKRSNTSPLQQDSFTGTLSTIQDGQRSHRFGYFGLFRGIVVPDKNKRGGASAPRR